MVFLEVSPIRNPIQIWIGCFEVRLPFSGFGAPNKTGIPAAVVMEKIGHESEQMGEHYARWQRSTQEGI
jgi:hypothetical protein